MPASSSRRMASGAPRSEHHPRAHFPSEPPIALIPRPTTATRPRANWGQRRGTMRFSCTLVILALLVSLTPAEAQEIKRGGKDWVALEKTLEDVNNQWLCAYQYYKPKAQDCVNFRAQYWADQFFEVYPNGQVQTKDEMVKSQTENAMKHPDTAKGEGP